MAEVADRREVYLRAQALVSRVYALPEGERDAYVDKETTTDPQLRDEVRWLLEALAAPDDDFLETPATASLPGEETDLKVPAPRNYTLIRPIGEGGMGVVYLAERVEGELKQVVALKLLNLAAMLNPAVVSRFLTERQLLAKLNHPNIARLIDAGALADGRPFLAMEYVEGTELNHYCEAKQLGIKARIQIFMKICQAVQYAHQHLIIHRDLKPANVLVTGDGEPKLVDFGIARLWSNKGEVTTQTMGVERIMTLAYASPEQLAGKPLSTMTDVYSLGIILYELLAGERPWGAATEPLALAREIGQSEPVPPSVKRRQTQNEAERAQGRLTGWRWRLPNELPRDLDAIVLKALRLNPEDRYESAQAFADDLHRFLTNRPVKALQGHSWYRTRKYLRRNWVPLTVTAAIVAMTAGYIVDRQIQLDKTERERAKVQQVRDFLIGLFKEVQPAYTQGQNISAKEMLDRGAKRLESAPPQDPTTRIALLKTLGETYIELGESKTALTVFNRAIQDARILPNVPEELLDELLYRRVYCENVAGDTRNTAIYLDELLARLRPRVATSYELLVRTLLSQSYHRLRLQLGIEQVEAPLKEAAAVLERYGASSPLRADVELSWADKLRTTDRFGEAISHAKLAVELFTKQLGKEHADTFDARQTYGFALCRSGATREGLAALQTLTADIARSLGKEARAYMPANAALGTCLMMEGRWAEVAEVLSEILKSDPTGKRLSIQWRISAKGNRVLALARAGQLSDVEAMLRELTALIQQLKEGPERSALQSWIDRGGAALALARGAFAEAEGEAKAALSLIESKRYPPTLLSDFRLILGDSVLAQGKHREAEEIFRGLAIDSQPRTESYQVRLAKSLMEQRRFDEAERLLRRAEERLNQNQSAKSEIKLNLRRAQQRMAELKKIPS